MPKSQLDVVRLAALAEQGQQVGDVVAFAVFDQVGLAVLRDFFERPPPRRQNCLAGSTKPRFKACLPEITRPSTKVCPVIGKPLPSLPFFLMGLCVATHLETTLVNFA